MFRQVIMAYTLLVILCSLELFGQELFEDVPKSEAMECVFDFVDNRAKYKAYGCFINAQFEAVRSSGIHNREWDACVFEDSVAKLYRSDCTKTHRLDQGNDEERFGSDSWSVFELKGRKRLFNLKEEHGIASIPAIKEKYFVPDPWMATIASVRTLEYGLAGYPDFWKELLDESNLLWAEESSNHVRGEWKFGSGEGLTYVQVYFRNEQPRLPVFVRYVPPKDQGARFSKKGDMVSELDVLWQEFDGGFVPIEIRFRREDFWIRKSGTKSTETGVMKFQWSTALCEEGKVDDRVFKPNTLTLQDLKEIESEKKSKK